MAHRSAGNNPALRVKQMQRIEYAQRMTHTSSPFAVLQAKQQAWLITLLTVVSEAYELGAVIGKGARIIPNEASNDVLTPDVTFMSNKDRKRVQADAIRGPALLAIDVLHSRVPEAEREALRRRYAAAHVLEYWQVDADRGWLNAYQASAKWQYDLIPPDAKGLHYSAAMVELAFPVKWFREQPGLLTLMQWWGLIEDEED